MDYLVIGLLLGGLLVGGSLAESTLKQRLNNIESFYIHVDSISGYGALDDALGRVNIIFLEEMLEAFFVMLTNVPEVELTSEQRWKDALSFVKEICERIQEF